MSRFSVSVLLLLFLAAVISTAPTTTPAYAAASGAGEIFGAAAPEGIASEAAPAADAIPTHAPDRVIVKWTAGVAPDAAAVEALLTRYGATVDAPLFDLSRGDIALKQRLGLDRVYILSVAPSQLDAAVAGLDASPLTVYAELDYIGTGALSPNDPSYPQQWSYNNTGQTGGTPDADVDAPEAWELSTGSADIIIAVIDSGLDMDHPDVGAKNVPGYDFVNNDSDPSDDHGHGTHVSGTAAGITDNSVGVAGICWACKVMPIKGLNSSNFGSYSWWTSGIEYAVDNGAHVINMSLGGSSYSSSMHDAVQYAHAAGVPIAAAMHNYSTNAPYYPAAYAETIGVGATDHNDVRASWSNYGSHIDLVAPGVSVLSTLWNNTYASWSGTSMATPHVAGAIGLMLSENPGRTVEEIRTRLKATADDQVGGSQDTPGWDQYYGAGRLNVASLLAAEFAPFADVKANGSDEPVTIYAFQGLDLTVQLDAAGQTGAAEWWLIAEAGVTTYYYNYATGQWSATPTPAATIPLGDLAPTTLSFTSPPSGAWTITFGVDTIINGQPDLPPGAADSVMVTVL